MIPNNPKQISHSSTYTKWMHGLNLKRKATVVKSSMCEMNLISKIKNYISIVKKYEVRNIYKAKGNLRDEQGTTFPL